MKQIAKILTVIVYALKTASALGFYTCAVKDAWAEREREEILSLCDAYLSLDEK